MVYLLVKLTRFVNEKEQEKLAKDLVNSLREFSNNLSVTNDTWGYSTSITC